jgi:polar amino acid transport system permease protein
MLSLLHQIPLFFTYYNVMLLLWGIGSTIALTVAGCGAGFVIGALIVLVRIGQAIWLIPLQIVVITYVEFFRRIPFLVILYLVLFGAQAIDPTLSLFGVAVVSVCLLATAYLSEIIRAGIQSVQRPQIEAAVAMNFGFWRTMYEVVLPQAWKVLLPPATAFVIMFIKDTSLASQIGVIELMFTGKILANRSFSGLLVYSVILICYFVISYPLSRLAAWMERRLAAPTGTEPQRILRTTPGLTGYQSYG